MAERQYVRWLGHLSSADTGVVGGKNASLGEMIGALKKQKIRVPDGFATTAQAYRAFLDENDLRQEIEAQLARLEKKKGSLEKVGKSIRSLFLRAEFPEPVREAIAKAYAELCAREKTGKVDVAVRSSATAEDLPEASFAGQQETFLNVTGEKQLLDACKKCYASLFTDRAISYRTEKNFDHMEVALSPNNVLEIKRRIAKVEKS